MNFLLEDLHVAVYQLLISLREGILLCTGLLQQIIDLIDLLNIESRMICCLHVVLVGFAQPLRVEVHLGVAFVEGSVLERLRVYELLLDRIFLLE